MAVATETVSCTSFEEGALFNALNAAVSDEAFRLPTDPARKALQIATSVLKTCEGDSELMKNLSHRSKLLLTLLAECIPTPAPNGLNKVQRQQMWANYHALICSNKFRDHWTIILGQRCATLSQFLSRHMLDQLLLYHYPLPQSSSEQSFPPELTSVEENALRYAAGYVVHSVKKQLMTKGGHPMRSALLYGLDDMGLEDDFKDSSQDWLDAVDRGGLVHVNHTAFKFFHAMEMELRQHLTVSKIEEMNDSSCRVLKAAVEKDVDVQYYFLVLTDDLEHDEQKSLLSLVVDLYITVRGYAFSKSWLEMYKREETITEVEESSKEAE